MKKTFATSSADSADSKTADCKKSAQRSRAETCRHSGGSFHLCLALSDCSPACSMPSRLRSLASTVRKPDAPVAHSPPHAVGTVGVKAPRRGLRHDREPRHPGQIHGSHRCSVPPGTDPGTDPRTCLCLCLVHERLVAMELQVASCLSMLILGSKKTYATLIHICN